MRGGVRNLIRAKIAGDAAVGVAAVAAARYGRRGAEWLTEGAKRTLQDAASRVAETLVATATPPGLRQVIQLVPRLEPRSAQPRVAGGSSSIGAAVVAKGGAESGAKLAKAAGLTSRQLLRHTGRAAAAGFVIDGARGGVEADLAFRRGRLDRRGAWLHAGREAATGALSTTAGIGLAAGAVALTGAMPAAVVFVIGAGGAIAAKRILTRALGAPALG
jgi:hypothetical protein